MTPACSNKKHQGITIVQLMLVLFIAGIAGSILINFIIDKRCEAEPATEICANRQ